MNTRPSLDDKKNKFDIKKHCVLCCKGESKYKLVSTETGMQNLRHAAQDQNDLALLSRIEYKDKFYYHVKNYACYKSYIRKNNVEPLRESREKENIMPQPCNSSRRRFHSLDNASNVRQGKIKNF